MNEGTFINYVVNRLRKLPAGSSIHSQSMTFGSRSFAGTPDRYFDGPGGDLWVEFKYMPSVPRSGVIGGMDEKKQGFYRAKQVAWLERRFKNNSTLEDIGVTPVRRITHHRVFGLVALPNNLVAVHTRPEEWRGGSRLHDALPREGVVDMLYRLLT